MAIETIAQINITGSVHEGENISAIEILGDLLIIGSDESRDTIQILRKCDDHNYKVIKDLQLPVDKDRENEEIDIESIAKNSKGEIFVVGSHSLKRKKTKSDKSYLKNRNRLSSVVSEDKKNRIFKLTIDPETGKKKSEDINTKLKEILEEDAILSRFINIPSKENGIDIEGLAVVNNVLYLGFRGPVLRQNYVPVLVADFDKLANYEIRFVQLKGNGIRDMTQVADGFLLVAGPVGDGLGPYELFFWNGQDTIPGIDRPMNDHLHSLGEIPCPHAAAKVEGIAVIEENTTTYQAIVVYDGVPNGGPTLMRIDKP